MPRDAAASPEATAKAWEIARVILARKFRQDTGVAELILTEDDAIEHIAAALDEAHNAAIEAAVAACEAEMRKKQAIAAAPAQAFGCSLCAVVVRALRRPVST